MLQRAKRGVKLENLWPLMRFEEEIMLHSSLLRISKVGQTMGTAFSGTL